MITVVRMYLTKEDAGAAFKREVNAKLKWPGLTFNLSNLSVTGQGILMLFRHGGGEQLKGLEIDKFFFDEIGPFWGNTHLQKLFRASENKEI